MFKRISFESRLIVIWVRIKDSEEDTAGVVGTCVYIWEYEKFRQTIKIYGEF